MKKFYLVIILFTFFLNSPVVFAATTVWDLNTTSEYTVSDSTKINLTGTVAEVMKTDLNHVFQLNDDGTTELSGASNIDIVGDYAYVTAYLDDGVEIFDISDPTAPVSVGRITDDLTTELDGAWDIQVVGDYAYVVSFLDDGLEILDISDPTTPTHVGAITDDATTRLDGASAIKVVGDYAYISSYSNNGLEIIDISNPAAPTHVAALGDDVTRELAGAYGIDVVGNYAYVASYTDDGVEIIDISNPASPTHVGAITDDATTELNGARGIVVVGDYAYVAGLDDNGFEVLDISDPTTPTHVAKIADDATTELSGASEIAIYGDYAFVTAYFDDGVEMIDISDPTNPIHVGAINNGPGISLNGAVGIDTINGNYLFVASRDNSGVEMISVDYHDDNPYVTANNSALFDTTIDSFSVSLGSGNEGSISYQLSPDNGSNWYYWNNNIWTLTTATDGTETSSFSEVNNNIFFLDSDGGEFLWRAYLESDGSQKVELDSISIETTRPQSSGGGGGKRVLLCRDTLAINYSDSRFGKTDNTTCEYNEPHLTVPSSAAIIGSGQCGIDLIVTENLRKNARDGQYDAYQGGTVTEVALLQAHINRILAAQYNEAAGPVDGIFGPLTKQGVERLQIALNDILKPEPTLVIDGIVGPFTRSAINNSCGEN